MRAEASPNSDLSRLFAYFQQYKARMAGGFLSVAATSVLLVATPRVVAYAIDSLSEAVTPEKLLLYGGVIVGLTFAQGVFRFLMRWLMIGVSRRIEYDLRGDVFAHLERLPAAFFKNHFTGADLELYNAIRNAR